MRIVIDADPGSTSAALAVLYGLLESSKPLEAVRRSTQSQRLAVIASRAGPRDWASIH